MKPSCPLGNGSLYGMAQLIPKEVGAAFPLLLPLSQYPESLSTSGIKLDCQKEEMRKFKEVTKFPLYIHDDFALQKGRVIQRTPNIV